MNMSFIHFRFQICKKCRIELSIEFLDSSFLKYFIDSVVIEIIIL